MNTQYAFQVFAWLALALLAPLAVATQVDEATIIASEQDGRQWLSHGRTYDEQRFSPLDQITAQNAGKLGLAWSLDLDNHRGLESTPLFVDGVLYTTLSWSRAIAVDAHTGKTLWSFDPKVARDKSRDACCDAVNRGVALWNGKVFIGTLDGRLIALDAQTGKQVWSQQTTDNSKPYTITGAPRVVKGKVIIGNGGAEYGVRGYFSAYDAESGKMAWRFYTVPGDPSKPYEHPELAEAAKTWKGDQYWELGGGGTAWDSMAYDPELDLLYVGTGNGSPWNRELRSPGGGDNLYLSSILAIKPDSGRLAWHYQVTPGDTWDFTATQQITLATLEIDGKPREVLMQAPKNGFFYVIDRQTGELLSAEKFGKVTWAEKIDLATGKPVEAPGVRYENEPIVMWPSPFGAHSWHSMSFNPQTGLVYIPYQEVPGVYRNEGNDFVARDAFNTGAAFSDTTEIPREAVSGALLAWDPIKQKEAWRVPYAHYWNGGTLTTAGNLVFQGTADGNLIAYSADDGKKLWSFGAQTGIVAAPMTYSLEGEQYVAVMAGWGGGSATYRWRCFLSTRSRQHQPFIGLQTQRQSHSATAARKSSNGGNTHTKTGRSVRCGCHRRQTAVRRLLLRLPRCWRGQRRVGTGPPQVGRGTPHHVPADRPRWRAAAAGYAFLQGQPGSGRCAEDQGLHHEPGIRRLPEVAGNGSGQSHTVMTER